MEKQTERQQLDEMLHKKDMGPFLRTPYNYNRDAASQNSGLACEDKTRTQQHFKEETDINTIVERFLKTGALPADVRVPQYGDYEGVFDFQTAMNAVRSSQEAFDALPAKIRARFHNDPQELLEFIVDEGNRDEARKLGLLKDPVDKETGELLPDPQRPPAAPTTPKVDPKEKGTT